MNTTVQKSARKRGNRGENAVCRHLRLRGYRILQRNFTVKGGEIDIIATRFRYIVFVEVKTRSAATDTEKYGHPADSVTEEKKQHLRHAASRYLSLHPNSKKPRFDVAEVYLPKEGRNTFPKIRYIKEAF
ncbi:MAG: YraN family protein [Clostridia bacterium]|nr:YraN family protein [Clostridia bacterium]